MDTNTEKKNNALTKLGDGEKTTMRIRYWIIAITIIGQVGIAGAETDPVERCMGILKYGKRSTVYEPSKDHAAITLGLIADKRAVPLLIEHLKHEHNGHLRCSIAKALGWIGGKRAVSALIETLEKDDYEHCRGMAALALGDIGNKKTVPALEKALKDDDYYVRSYAAQALKKITGKDYPVEGEGRFRGKLQELKKIMDSK